MDIVYFNQLYVYLSQKKKIKLTDIWDHKQIFYTVDTNKLIPDGLPV